jgi:hypothetical protein
MTKTTLFLACAALGLTVAQAQAVPLPPERPDLEGLTVKVQDMDSGSTTVVKKHGVMGDKTTVIHRHSEPTTTGVVVKRRTVEPSDCKHVTVRKEDGMGNSVTKHKTACD